MASSWNPGESCSETADTPPCWTRAFLRYRRPASEVPRILCSKVCQIRSVSGPILELFQPYLLLFFDFRPGNYTAIRWESVHYKKPNDSFLRDFCRFSPISRLEFIFQKRKCSEYCSPLPDDNKRHFSYDHAWSFASFLFIHLPRPKTGLSGKSRNLWNYGIFDSGSNLTRR